MSAKRDVLVRLRETVVLGNDKVNRIMGDAADEIATLRTLVDETTADLQILERDVRAMFKRLVGKG